MKISLSYAVPFAAPTAAFFQDVTHVVYLENSVSAA